MSLRTKLLSMLADKELTNIECDKEIDYYLSLNTSAIIHNNRDHYPETNANALLTSYRDFSSILKYFDNNNKYIFHDLGSGLSRSIFLNKVIGENIQIIGHEFNKERVNRTKEALAKNNLLEDLVIHQDLLRSPLPIGNIYFSYLPVGPLFYKITNELYELAKTKEIYFVVIDAHGDTFFHLDKIQIFHKHIKEIKLSSSRYNNIARIYRLNISSLNHHNSKLMSLWRNGNSSNQLIKIHEEKKTWVANTYNFWLHDNKITFELPNRTIDAFSLGEIYTDNNPIITNKALLRKANPKLIKKIYL